VNQHDGGSQANQYRARHRSAAGCRPPSDTALACGLVFVAALFGTGCNRSAADAENSSRPASTQRASMPEKSLQSGKGAPQDSGSLMISGLPPSAQAALLKSDAAFVPFDPSKYPPEIVASAHRSADEGLVVIRGDLQGKRAMDFAVAGISGDSVRVLALFAEQGGAYRVVDVYSNRHSMFAKTMPPDLPVLYIERAPCEFRCGSKSAFAIVLKLVADSRPSRNILAWDSKLHRFVSDEPVD
jgi:hypothetical protein